MHDIVKKVHKKVPRLDPDAIEFLHNAIMNNSGDLTPEEVEEVLTDYSSALEVGTALGMALNGYLVLQFDPEFKQFGFDIDIADNVLTSDEKNARRLLQCAISEIMDLSKGNLDPLFAKALDALNNDEPLPAVLAVNKETEEIDKRLMN